MLSSPPSPLHQPQINTTAVAGDNSSATTTTIPTLWSSETNWTVSRGSLDTAVTFESFDIPIDSESTAPKPPLLLVPPSSSDFEPCEIKINFTQKHEIRQVYVRSTARVYEIYYAPAPQTESEYLCTVRCSAASVEDSLLIANDVKEAVSVNLEGPNGILSKEKVAVENNIGANEDDWVEIKLPGGRPDEGNGFSTNRTSNNIINYQDYYEATAEINDSEPCISLMLRLLSLQNKGYVYIDEIYIFADPIDTNDSDNQTVNPENSSGSTLMTMLVPTLLGLAKSRSVKKPEPLETEPKLTTSTNPVNHTEPVWAPAHSQVESVLEQLVSRVSRIEDIFLRFEENMLKPINSIEARLERVEQQVKLLTKNSQFSRFELNPKNENENDSKLCGESESEKAGFSCCDEKTEANDVLESPKREKPKKYASIDDALAAALAGFSSFTNIDMTLEGSNSSESLKEIAPDESIKSRESPKVEIDCCDDEVVSPVYENEKTVDTLKTSEIGVFESAVDEEAVGPTQENFTSITDILKHFPEDQSRNGAGLTWVTSGINDRDGFDSECKFDFESPILEVKFASFENDNLKSPLEALLSYTGDNGVVITQEMNMCDLEEENVTIGNDLLVEFDGDFVGEGVEPDLATVHEETSFESLI